MKCAHCDDRAVARGLCNRHWKRWRTYGDPLKAQKPKKRAGETVIDASGYLRIRGNRHVHREMAAQKLGRPLRPGEVVHHIDGNKLNNHPDNLIIFASQAEHSAHHAAERRKEIKRT